MEFFLSKNTFYHTVCIEIRALKSKTQSCVPIRLVTSASDLPFVNTIKTRYALAHREP